MSSEREKAIEAFQTKEFIDFALSSAQTAQEMSNKEEELRAEEEMLNHEKHIIMENVEELKKIRSQLETQHRNVSVALEPAARCVCVRENTSLVDLLKFLPALVLWLSFDVRTPDGKQFEVGCS